MKIAILDDYFDTIRHLPCFAKLAGHDVTIFRDHEPEPHALAARLKGFEAVVLIRERTQITAEFLALAKDLKLISQYSVYPHIDVAAATKAGVLISSFTGAAGASYAAAELTLALMLASFRNLPQELAALKQGVWQTGVGRTLRGKRLGLYGFGRIGQVVAGYGAALGMDVVFHGRAASLDAAEAQGFHVARDRRAFFSACDIVSLHLRLTPETRAIVTPDDLAMMKPDSLLINTSRAGLIAPGVLEAALRAGRPGFAALDVFEEEPLRDPTHPLLNMANVIATPHIGYVTRDEFEKQFSMIFDQILAYAAGAPINIVNPQALS
jgi:D-3-phosphoglycerate dehydrogenase